MKNLICHARLLTLLGAFSITAGNVCAAESNTAPSEASVPAPTVSVTTSTSATTSAREVSTVPAKLPTAAAEVVKLSQAQVNEDVIVSYVQNSGATSGL